MRIDRQGLLIVTALLLAVGTVMVYSSSAIVAQERYGDAAYFLKRHLIFLTLGVLISGWILSLDPKNIRRWAKPLMGVALLFLVAVLIPGWGHKVSGAARWFRLGEVSIQPSEFAQLAVILYMADVLSRKRGQLEDFFHGVLPSLVVLGVAVGLILAEPDLGTAVALGFVAILILFVAQVRAKFLLPMFLASIPLIGILILMKPYRIRRMVGFLNPWADPEGAGFQLIQSLVALGSGGLMGVGLGESRQKLFYLPAAHTDFIFSVIGEEWGFLGVSFVLLLVVFLVWFGIRVSMNAPDSFGFLVGFGIVMLLALEALIHIGVATGVVPTKGLPFPFISYGGTSLVVNLMSLAILLNVARPRQVVAA